LCCWRFPLRRALLGKSGRRVVHADRYGGATCDLLAIDAELLIDQTEQPDLRPDRLSLSQDEKGVRVQGVVEDRDQSLLRHDVHVDENVATQDQGETRRRRGLCAL